MNDRQKSKVFGVESTVRSIVNPESVQPDIASKMLSVQLIWRPRTNGTLPTRAMATQINAAAARATDSCGTYSRVGIRDIRRPRRMNMMGTETIGTSMSHSRNMRSTTSGTRVITPRYSKMIPMSWAMMARVSSRFMIRSFGGREYLHSP
ncbi:MAG: hypothetical protein A4E42_01503 [Methanoregulaceae archaeon PtaU1.Bin222]|nr:MAG: hypothetical protein A4E42_01503 [Methanoregulaceae archaeon PtaU1.Bin222]